MASLADGFRREGDVVAETDRHVMADDALNRDPLNRHDLKAAGVGQRDAAEAVYLVPILAHGAVGEGAPNGAGVTRIELRALGRAASAVDRAVI